MLLEPILYNIGPFLVVENIRGIMNRGLNIVVIVLVLASISVGGVSGETSSGIELSEEEIRMVGIGQIDRSDFVVQTPNLATSISMDRKIILGELNKYILEERISSAGGEDEKREILFQAATDVEIESVDTTDRFVEIQERWKSGWIGSEEFTRELMLISTDSKVLGGLLDLIEEESEMVSQIELRGMAHLSEDIELCKAFNNNIDIHSRTASLIYNVSLDDIIPEMRRTAKVVNFGIMYGAGAFRISQELGISRVASQEIIDEYFKQYSGIKTYIDRILEKARKNNCVETISGRRRPIWDANSENSLRRKAAERIAINMTIQRSAAELIKIAMIDIYKKLLKEDLKSKMILQIHDELLFEFPEDEEDILISIVVNSMEQAMRLRVPIIVDYGVGNNWYEAH